MLTPVGELTKAETRAYARRLGLATADKPESVEICFVPDDDYVGVLERHLPADAPALAPGPLVTTAGEVIGEHDGYARYTIGQRKGLPGGFAEPRFVVAIRPERREVVVGTADELAGHRVRLEELNWLADPLDAGRRLRGADPLPGPRACPRPSLDAARTARSSWRSTRRSGPSRPASPACSTAPGGRVLGGGVIAS